MKHFAWMLVLAVLSPLALSQRVGETLYEWKPSAGVDGWYTTRAESYGWGASSDDLLEFDSRGWLRSWSASPKLWWPDGNHACYHPFLVAWTKPPCTGWLSLVAYRMTPNQAIPPGGGFPFGDEMDFRRIRVTLSARARTDGDTPAQANFDRIKDGTGERPGLHNYSPAQMYLWAQSVIGYEAYNYALYMNPFELGPEFPNQPVVQHFRMEDWTCLGAGVVPSQQQTYDCLPPSAGLLVNRDWGFLLMGIDPRDNPPSKPVGFIEIRTLKIERVP